MEPVTTVDVSWMLQLCVCFKERVKWGEVAKVEGPPPPGEKGPRSIFFFFFAYSVTFKCPLSRQPHYSGQATVGRRRGPAGSYRNVGGALGTQVGVAEGRQD